MEVHELRDTVAVAMIELDVLRLVDDIVRGLADAWKIRAGVLAHDRGLAGNDLACHVLELRDAREVLGNRVVHGADRLELVLGKRLEDHVDRAVRKRTLVEAEELVESAGVDDLAAIRLAAHHDRGVGELHDGADIDIEEDIDQVVVQHVLEELRVAILRHALVRCLREVAVVVADEDRHAAHDSRIDLVGSLAPLLHRVVQEDVLVDVVCNLSELRIVLLAELEDGDLLVLAERCDELAVEVLALLLAEGKLQRLVVERHRHERAMDVCKHLVLIVRPLSEAGQEVMHAVVVRMVDMRTILVDEDACLVLIVVGVARDVVAALDDADLEVQGLCQAAGTYCSCITRTDDEDVVAVSIEIIRQTMCDIHTTSLTGACATCLPYRKKRSPINALRPMELNSLKILARDPIMKASMTETFGEKHTNSPYAAGLSEGAMMSSFLDRMKQKAKSDLKTIVLPEGEDPRTIEAAKEIVKEGLAKLVILGDPAKISVEGVEVIDPKTAEKHEAYAELFAELRKKKGVTIEDARKQMDDATYFGTMMVKAGDADGLVSGACHSTANTLRPALQILKTAPGTKLVSAFFIMCTDKAEYGDKGTLLFADCGLNIAPTAEELSEIALASAESWKKYMSSDPKVAMLSFSTKGSAKGDIPTKVQEATKLAQEKNPELALDGDLQLDAALVPSVAELKAPGSEVAGHANVLVFPDLEAGNIGYKLVQRFAGAEAYGPILQGIAKPVNDLSRGCSAQDIVGVVAITAVQAQMAE